MKILFDPDAFESVFRIMVKDINTLNPNWKQSSIDELYLNLDNYLAREYQYGSIFEFNLSINRIGQSKVECNLEYLVRFYHPPKYLNFTETVKTPSQVIYGLHNSLKRSLIHKISENHLGLSVALSQIP